MKKADYMLDTNGAEYDGMDSSVKKQGLFVDVLNTLPGLVPVSYFTDDYYRYDEQHFAMIGQRTVNVLRISYDFSIRVNNVSKDERAIEFQIVCDRCTLSLKYKECPVDIDQPLNGRNKHA